MNIFVLRIENDVIGAFKSIEDLYKLLDTFVKDDFNWDLLKNDFKIYYDFGEGFEEEVEIYNIDLK